MKAIEINLGKDKKVDKIIKLYSNNDNIKVIQIKLINKGGKTGINYYVVLASKVELSRDEFLRPNIWLGQFNGKFNGTYFYEVRFNRYL